MSDVSRLILDSKVYELPEQFKKSIDISKDIYRQLIKGECKYVVQSRVSEEVFKTFVKYLNDGTEPEIFLDTVYELRQLAQEFKMSELIQKIDAKKKKWRDLENSNQANPRIEMQFQQYNKIIETQKKQIENLQKAVQTLLNEKESNSNKMNLIDEIKITDAVPYIVFENKFNFTRWSHYRLEFDFLETSTKGAQVRMQFGYNKNGFFVYENNINEYFYSTADFAGSAGRYAAYTHLYGYFGFGNDEKFYRNDGGLIHGCIEFWNDGNPAHRVYAQTKTNSFRVANDTPVATGGICNFVYNNVGSHVINAFKLIPSDGKFNTGRFQLYGVS